MIRIQLTRSKSESDRKSSQTGPNSIQAQPTTGPSYTVPNLTTALRSYFLFTEFTSSNTPQQPPCQNPSHRRVGTTGSINQTTNVKMSFRAREMYKKVVREVGSKDLPKGVMESIQGMLPNSKVVMNRAQRGIFAGRHIRFGNKVSEDGGNKSRRSWKPNVQEKRLFSYIHDRHIRVKVTTHALRCIDKAGGIDEYLLKTPYNKMETELGVIWKARIEKMYAQLGQMEVGLFSPDEEAKIEKGFEEAQAAKKEETNQVRREVREEGKQKGGGRKGKVVVVG
ncbi:hypothetical protein LUZ63_000592 [Rhynchospora breviuscula]|uniref:Large ribosomal subunit protein bL28m n=1 Tax=Rhynchospora breviuscula TaxID=2022672 RepID=A0A9Q0HX15_9POAL|nr:hypothetical protein LUZ63_000592 [Rhynchospora breviuscula]